MNRTSHSERTGGGRRRARLRFAPRRQRGFTAIEIAMVATVIAILALLVLPLFRNRVEEAKIAAAQADLTSLMKAEQLVQADTGKFVRLEDLDNIKLNLPATPPANGVTLEIPITGFIPDSPLSKRAVFTLAEWNKFAGTEKLPKFCGPYIAFQRAFAYSDLLTKAENQTLANAILFSRTGNLASPIYDLPSGTLKDSPDNRIPIDPWGNPYMFFPATDETSFRSNVIYSMGPNGVPGNNLNASTPNDYLRGASLGFGTPNTDDLVVQF